MAWNVVSAYVLDQAFGYQGANRFRENLIALASARIVHSLGGSRATALPLVASAQDAIDYIDAEIDGTALGGFTKQARVEVRTTNAATSITPRVQNTTDATTAGTGVACTATNTDYSGTAQRQTIALTIATGIKKYRLQGTPQNTTNGTHAIGYIEMFATA